MSEIKTETRKESLGRLFTANGLVKEDVYKDKRGFFKELLLKKNIKFNNIFTACSYSKKKCHQRLALSS